MASKDEKNLAAVLKKIDSMAEPERFLVQRTHEVIMDAAPELKPRIWYGMPAYALSASAPALITLRNDERVNLALTEKVELVPAGGNDGMLMLAAWFFDSMDEATKKRIAEIIRRAIS
jgi:hypothetical protein